MPGSTDPVLVEKLAWPEIAETLDDVLLLPVGATEQHGPHLPVNTDSLIASAACHYASAATGAPVLPCLAYTVSLGHTEKWPGTFAIFHETLIKTVRDIARWAVASGWKRLLIVNSHFGNDAALRCVVDRLRFELVGRLLVAVRNTWALTQSIAARFSHDAADWHANEAETSLLLHIAPELVHTDRLESADDPDRTEASVFQHMVAHTSANGVTGKPSLANAESGASLLREIGEALVALIQRARSEGPPLTWTRTTTAFA
jgi:creatinine amidohydrolase